MKKFMAIFVAIMITVMVMGCGGTMQIRTESIPVIEEVGEDGEIVTRPAYGDDQQGPTEVRTEPRRCTSARGDLGWCIFGGIMTVLAVGAAGAAIGVAAQPDYTTVGNR